MHGLLTNVWMIFQSNRLTDRRTQKQFITSLYACQRSDLFPSFTSSCSHLQPELGSVEKPEEIFHIIEHFCLGRRRLHLFGTDNTIRPGEGVCVCIVGMNKCLLKGLIVKVYMTTKKYLSSCFVMHCPKHQNSTFFLH